MGGEIPGAQNSLCNESKVKLIFLMRKPHGEQSSHLLRSAAAEMRDQQKNRRTFRHVFTVSQEHTRKNANGDVFQHTFAECPRMVQFL